MASDSFNNKAVAIRFPHNSEALKLIKDELEQVKSKLMGVHRFIFFPPIRPGKSTEAQDTLKWLKETLGDKPSQETPTPRQTMSELTQ